MILGYPWMAANNIPLDWSDPTKNPRIFASWVDWVIKQLQLEEGNELFMHIWKTTHSQQFTEAAHDKTICPWTDLVPNKLHQYQKVFSEEEAQCFPEPKHWDHKIELLENAPMTLNCKIYPLTHQEHEAQDKFLAEHLQKGYIWSSSSPYAAPFFFIKKKDSKLQPVQDYQRLNTWTKKNKYPLPLIADLVNQAPGKDWYSTIDIRWGYNNIRIKDGDQWKAAFKTDKGLFEPLIMFFGLTNSPATF